MVNQKKFFKKDVNQKIDEILSKIQDYENTLWPFFDEFDNLDWHANDQPLTHVQVSVSVNRNYSWT